MLQFTEVRGEEGTHGDPFRVGGIYNGYGMRYARIMITLLAMLTCDGRVRIREIELAA